MNQAMMARFQKVLAHMQSLVYVLSNPVRALALMQNLGKPTVSNFVPLIHQITPC